MNLCAWKNKKEARLKKGEEKEEVYQDYQVGVS